MMLKEFKNKIMQLPNKFDNYNIENSLGQSIDLINISQDFGTITLDFLDSDEDE